MVIDRSPVPVSRSDIVAEARTWIGTPFKPHRREKGVGCDCIGFLIGIAWSFSMTEFDDTDYPPNGADSSKIRRFLDDNLQKVNKSQMDVGDIVLISEEENPPIHVGMLVDRPSSAVGGFNIVHSMTRAGGVKEHRLSSDWRRGIVAVYRLPGLAD